MFLPGPRALDPNVNEVGEWKMADVYHLNFPATLRPYDFVFYSLEVIPRFDLLQSGEVWGALATWSRYAGEDTVGGERCAVIEIEVPNHGRNGIDRSKVYLAAEKEFFPVRYEHYIGNDIYEIFEATDLFKAVESCRHPDEGHYFAARAIKQEFDRMGSGAPRGGQLWEMPAERTRINAEIPDAFFTIARSEALFVIGE